MRNSFVLLIALILAGCSAPLAEAPSTAAATVLVTPPTEAVPAYPDEYEISAWVDIPDPELDEIVTVSGSLVRNGEHVGGVGMWMFWPDETGSPVPHECVSYMMYQRGICQIIVKDYPPGQYVPVTVRVEYHDQIFTTETGFTPQED